LRGSFRAATIRAQLSAPPDIQQRHELSTFLKRSTGMNHRLRFELIFASIWLAFGLFVLPALIYGVGILLLGPYGENAGLGAFYADFFGDLVAPTGRAWALVLGPLVLISVLRLLFLDVRSQRPEDEEAPHTPRTPPAREQARVEPRVSLE
jgi:hypothetical protein